MHPHHPLSPPDHRARRLLRAAFTSWLIVAQSGCQSPTPKRIGPPSAAEAVRNNCYSLLHQLLDDEKNVSKILIIKRDRKELGDLIKEISAASRAGATKLEEFSKEDPSFPLQEYGLPPGENATRDAIAATRKHELLHTSGEQFEVNLLLTQIEALGYASHLYRVIAANENRTSRTNFLVQSGAAMDQLRQRAVELVHPVGR